MKLDQTFDFAGFTTNAAGVRKLRVGRGDITARVKLLTRQGHTDINLIQLDNQLTREQAKVQLGVYQPGITVAETTTV